MDRQFWNDRWTEVLRDHADQVAQRPPNPTVTAMVAELAPGRALDAGCGHGSEALWLAARGWHVTAVDFAPAALTQAQARAEVLGTEVADRITWVEGDLATWTAESDAYDLVLSVYVHIASSVHEMVARLAAAVAPGGALVMVGHLPVDPTTGAATPAAGQVQVTVAEALAVLDPEGWELLVAEDQPRTAAGTGADAVVHARRR